MSGEIPASTNVRTRRIGAALRERGVVPWMGGRTRETYSEHGVCLPVGGDPTPIYAAVKWLGWPGVTVVDDGVQYNRAAGDRVHVYWVRVPRTP